MLVTGRDELTRRVSRALAGRDLVWVGTRGADVESITDIPQLTGIASVIGKYRNRSRFRTVSLEEFTGRRVDLDTFDIDSAPRDVHIVNFRRALFRMITRESAVFTYRPSQLVSSVCFSRLDRCRYLGVFSSLQTAFEHKPWVESSLFARGVPNLGWVYVADEDQMDVRQLLARGSVVLRRSRTTGGVGLARLDDINEIEKAWPDEDEAYVSVAPYVRGGVPVNVGAVVWDDGVTLHPCSVQLIGVASLTRREFGYCGNDFGAVSQFDNQTLDVMDEYTRVIGRWLHEFGYRGAFGVDYLVVGNQVYFTEVNPRLQGSTHLSSEVMSVIDEAGIVLEHLAATLGLEAPKSRSLRELASSIPAWSHFVVHAPIDGVDATRVNELVKDVQTSPSFVRVDTQLEGSTTAASGAAVVRVTIGDRVTDNGSQLLAPWGERVEGWRERLTVECGEQQ